MQNSQVLDKIGFYGNLIGAGSNHGYGYSASELIKAWQRKQMPVWWADKEAPVAFSFVQPQGYEYTNRERINIGYTPWESTVIPEAWPFYINKMTELWTTSNACKEWFEASEKIEIPIRVLHHGLNREHFPAKKRTMDGTFKFLHIGEPAPRKGGEMVYKAFKEAFGNDPTTKLVMKGSPRFEIDLDNVVVFDLMLSQEDLLDLYHRCHAFVYPGNGEGFGLLPFQAAATGMPTLTTNWGGSLDYMDYCWPLKVADLVEPNYEPHVGLWAQPDFDALIDWMIDVRSCPEIYHEDGYQAALNMDHYWSWDYQAEISLNWFREILHCY
jgi:glycosyltransferase involved in cell wall biosynthesis